MTKKKKKPAPITPFDRNFPGALDEQIKAHFDSQAAFGRACGVEGQTVGKWLARGKVVGKEKIKITKEHIKLVAVVFESDHTDLLNTGFFVPVRATRIGDLSKVAVDMARRFDALSAGDQQQVIWMVDRLSREPKKKRLDQRTMSVSRA